MGGFAIAVAVVLVLLIIIIAVGAMSAPAAPQAPATPSASMPAAKSATMPAVNVPLVEPTASVPVYQPTAAAPSFSTPAPATSAPVQAPAQAPVTAPTPSPSVASVAPNVAPVVTPATAPIMVTPAPPAPLPAKVIGAITAGCKQCSTSGLYWCPPALVTGVGTFNGQAAQVSTYRVSSYDPVDPPVNLFGDMYYWRQGADGCPNDPKPGASVVGCTKCLSKGMYWCPKGKIGTAPYGMDGAAALVSEQRYPQWDPVDPNVTLSDSKYYWRMAADSCGTY